MKSRIFSRTNRIVVAVVLVLAALVVLAKTYTVEHAYRQALARAERDTLNATGALAEHAARTFEGVSRALDATGGLHADVDAGDIAGATAIHDALRTIRGASPVILGIGWSDAAGDRVASSIFRDPPPLNLADQDHFSVHRDDPAVGLYISAPIRSRLDGTWIIAVSRRIEDAGGHFAGIVNAVLRLDYFLEFYRAINLGPDTVVLLVRRDGVLLVRAPMIEAWMGRPLPISRVIQFESIENRPGNLHTTSALDGRERVAGYRAIPGFPLVIAATMSRADALAPFREVLLASAIEGALTVAALAIGGAMLVVAGRRPRARGDRGAAAHGLRHHQPGDHRLRPRSPGGGVERAVYEDARRHTGIGPGNDVRVHIPRHVERRRVRRRR